MKFSKVAWFSACLFLMQAPGWGAPDAQMMAEAISLRDQGEFEKATRVLQSWLDATTTATDAADRRAIEFEVERIRRIRLDYTLTREALVAQLQDQLTTFTETELDAFERDGKLDVQLIDGQKLYVNTSASNLLFRDAELRKRRRNTKPDGSYVRLYEQLLTARKAAELTSLSLVTPQDYLVTFTLVVKPNVAPEGNTIRAWLPFVHHFPHQGEVAIIHNQPELNAVAPPEFPHRTIYMEQVSTKDEPSTFTVSFVYRCWSRVHNLDPALVREYDKGGAEYAFYTAERKPHIDFSSEELIRIDNEVSAGDPNPLLQARRIFDWIARNTIYQYAREYSTLDNISQYTAARRAGDCGQHAMLFIALCRMNGVPARWASGWESFSDRGQGMHDWAEFYVKPWGWLPADPDMAVNALNYADGLTTAQQTELASMFFGNMDHYRLTVNSDYGRSLYPYKTDFRSETVDFQRGEVEADGKNLYFDQWAHRMRIAPISAGLAEKLRREQMPEKVKIPPVEQPKSAADPETTVSVSAETTATILAEKETTGVEEVAPAVEAPSMVSTSASTATTATAAVPDTPTTDEPTTVTVKTEVPVVPDTAPESESRPASSPPSEPVASSVQTTRSESTSPSGTQKPGNNTTGTRTVEAAVPAEKTTPTDDSTTGTRSDTTMTTLSAENPAPSASDLNTTGAL